MTIELYCFGESGNAYKAALALELSGLDWRPVKVDFFGGETRRSAYRAINVMGEVPAMVDGELTLTQSGVILDYVAEKSGRFGGRDAAERREILRWILWDNHKLSGIIGSVRFILNFLPEDKRPLEPIPFLQGRLGAAYKVLDAHLADRDWIVGDSPSNADFSCCGYLYYPEPYGFDRSEWPGIDRWLTRLSSQTGWKAPYDLMPGSPADRAQN